MRSRTLLAAIAVTLTILTSCGDKLTSNISRLESEAFSTEEAMNPNTAEELVSAYLAFIDANPHLTSSSHTPKIFIE